MPSSVVNLAFHLDDIRYDNVEAQQPPHEVILMPILEEVLINIRRKFFRETEAGLAIGLIHCSILANTGIEKP